MNVDQILSQQCGPKTHCFDVALATEWGVVEAIIIFHLMFWLRHNAQNNRNIKDGEVWTYNSSEAFHRQLPYLTPRTIRRTLVDMEKNGLIKSSSDYNKKGFDKTKWYTVTEKAYISSLANMANHGPFLANDGPFLANQYQIETQIKKHKETTLSTSGEVGVFKEQNKPSGREKETFLPEAPTTPPTPSPKKAKAKFKQITRKGKVDLLGAEYNSQRENHDHLAKRLLATTTEMNGKGKKDYAFRPALYIDNTGKKHHGSSNCGVFHRISKLEANGTLINRYTCADPTNPDSEPPAHGFNRLSKEPTEAQYEAMAERVLAEYRQIKGDAGGSKKKALKNITKLLKGGETEFRLRLAGRRYLLKRKWLDGFELAVESYGDKYDTPSATGKFCKDVSNFYGIDKLYLEFLGEETPYRIDISEDIYNGLQNYVEVWASSEFTDEERKARMLWEGAFITGEHGIDGLVRHTGLYFELLKKDYDEVYG